MILVDSGALIAFANEADRYSAACIDALREASKPRLVPSVIVTEVAYMLRREAGVALQASFLRSFEDSSFFELLDVSAADLARAAVLVMKYHDLPLDAPDAILIALAERLDIRTVASVDSDMRIVRPRHGALTVVP